MYKEGKVIAVCTSSQKGTQKQNIKKALLKENHGLENDAHSGPGHRQVSLLTYDKVIDFNKQGADVSHGDFGENLLIQGIELKLLPIGTRLKIGECLLEITQIGKECHTKCQIYHKMGDCIMPKEGIFAKVLKEGYVEVEDLVEIIPKYTAAVVTLSDKGFLNEREDKSGPLISKMLQDAGYDVQKTVLLPDDKEEIAKMLINLCDNFNLNLIITTGGTGFSKRDVTPEATMAIAERVAPGIAQAIRTHSLNITPRAMLSRGVAVLRGNSLVINLPGSKKAVEESLLYILPHIDHGLDVLIGTSGDCGS